MDQGFIQSAMVKGKHHRSQRQAPLGEDVARFSIDLLASNEAILLKFAEALSQDLPKKLMGIAQYRTAMAWQRTEDPDKVSPWFLRDSPGFALVPEMRPTADEAIFDKITMSAFEGTPLAMALRDCGVRSVVLCGIALEIGIEPTARHAIDIGIVPIIVTDASGHGNEEAAQRTIVQLKFLGDTQFADTSEILTAWKLRRTD